MARSERSRPLRGFTLVELAVVIVVVGLLAAFGVPRFLKTVECSRAAGAFTYLEGVRDAQSRFHQETGTFASDLKQLGLPGLAPPFFSVGAVSLSGPAGAADSWSLTLTRTRPSGPYFAYTVTFNQDGYDPTGSSIDAVPEIVPAEVGARSR